jgi:hypothetical protein
MTTINPLAAALAALFDQSLQAAVTSSRELDENEVRDLVGRVMAPTVDRLDGRINAHAEMTTLTLQGLHERIATLEARVTDVTAQLARALLAAETGHAAASQAGLEARLAALEAAPTDLQRFADGRPITAESIREIAEAAAEAALDEHTSSYDHDDYDALHNEWGSEEASDFVKDGYLDDQIEEKVKEVLNNATFSVSI